MSPVAPKRTTGTRYASAPSLPCLAWDKARLDTPGLGGRTRGLCEQSRFLWVVDRVSPLCPRLKEY